MIRRRNDLFSSRKRARPGRLILLGLLLLVVLVGVYTAFDNGRIVVRTQQVFVSNLPKELEGFTVLQLSDLNGKRFGPAQKQLTNALKQKKYNAVCITGDMVGEGGDAYPFLEVLAALDATRPVFFISGDADPIAVGGHTRASVLADWVLSAQQSYRANFLGAPVSMEVGGATVWFSDASQLSLDLSTAASAYGASDSPVSAYYTEVIAQTQAARAQMREEDLHIVLTHNPLNTAMVQSLQGSQVTEIQQYVRSVDLILAGGTVGGQWKLPGMGPVWNGEWFPAQESTEGYRYAGTLLQYISSGLGTNSASPLPGTRLFNTPEITLLTFTSEIEEGVLPLL